LDDVTRSLNAAFSDPRCPNEVLALRDMAIKYHLMVLVSLAFVQEETDLGQEYVRRLVRVDPSILQGEPCELVDFLLRESIADESINHEELLQRIFSQLPPDTCSITEQYSWAVSRGYLLKGTRAIIWGRPKDGRSHFARAAELRAEVDEPFVQSLTHQLLAYENEFGTEVTKSALRKLAPYLAQVGGRRSVRRLKGCYAVNQALRSFQAAEYGCVPGKVIQAIINDPSYSLNRGVLSILVRSIASPRSGLDVR
jgi:hypothetical protein